jgi:FkbM family methyltransferase
MIRGSPMTTKNSLFKFANRLIAPLPFSLETSDRLATLRGAETRLLWESQLVEHEPNPETVPRGQVGQDLFALWATSFRRGGYFVEFGAADGVGLSNTLLLERSFGWNGIVAEPARAWHEELRKNRQCIVDTRCVWEQSGQQLTFIEPADAFYGTISGYADLDDNQLERRDSVSYPVETVSLNDLLEEHSAPSKIDYLSVDTEGTEFEILSTFDFDRYDVRVITVEHAYNPTRRDRLREHLGARGFKLVLGEMSRWDDWYVGRDVTLPSLVP